MESTSKGQCPESTEERTRAHRIVCVETNVALLEEGQESIAEESKTESEATDRGADKFGTVKGAKRSLVVDREEGEHGDRYQKDVNCVKRMGAGVSHVESKVKGVDARARQMKVFIGSGASTSLLPVACSLITQ